MNEAITATNGAEGASPPDGLCDAEADRALLIAAAREAGPIALSFFRAAAPATARSWAKEDGSAVTEADMAVNEALKARLTAARPDYGWLTEEEREPASPARLGRARTFVIDPIDGTRSFMEGSDAFCFSLAVVEAGRPIAAAVYAPARDALYDAVAGGGARLNEAPVPPAPEAEEEERGGPRPRVIVPARDLASKRWGGAPPNVRRFYVQPLAHRLCLVAIGAYDGVIALKTSREWDVAAGDLIAREAGLRVTDRSGAPLRFNKPVPEAPGLLAGENAFVERLLAARPRG